jgi:gas vesicle protein
MDFDLSRLRDLSLDDIDLNFLRKREEEAASRGFLGGFVLGVLVGAVIALVFAPRRGDETRELVAGAAGDLKGRATDLVQQVRSDSEGASEPGTGNLGDGPAIEREIGDAAETFGDTVETGTDDFGSRPRV